jgi:hypothetical protein
MQHSNVKAGGKPAHSTLKERSRLCSSETSVDFQRNTRRYIPEDSTLHKHRCENLKSYIHSVTKALRQCGPYKEQPTSATPGHCGPKQIWTPLSWVAAMATVSPRETLTMNRHQHRSSLRPKRLKGFVSEKSARDGKECSSLQ